ncbi:MAG: Fe-S cluster assembly protein SufD [Lysobacteraceae bacterium]
MSIALLDSLKANFDALSVAANDPRRDTFADALADGLPSTRSERWKYTSLRTLERRSFVANAPLPVPVDAALVADIPAPRIVFVNGYFDAALSELAPLANGVSLRSLADVVANGDARETLFLARRFEHADETFARLNAALALDGMLLKFTENTRVDQPIHFVSIGAPADADIAWHARNFIELRRGATITLVEHHIASGEHAHFGNVFTHVHLAAGATLRHACIQDDAARGTLITRTDAVIARDATYRRLDLELGAGLSRHELNVRLEGEGARVAANGVLLANGKRHIDTRLGIEHIARDTTCDLVWRGLASGRGRAVFHGGITIRAGADGSDAKLSNKNLLLSEGAEIDAQPVLEIHADEVKAAHGATVGHLDETALFYLRSRGLPATEARRLLTAAFCRETLSVLDDAALIEVVGAHLDAAMQRSEIA